MSVIHQLPAHIANLIAAGEVVERPASVVKELVENSFDAGAKSVVVEIQNGGMTFLRVTDDGCGMSPEDAETAFLRHATSKLHTAEDLAAIGTMGFRGEALAAVASVSRIDLMTRAAGSDEGVGLRLEAGKITERSPAGCPVGTTIIVRDLFYNTPARMKFMKSDSAEGAGIFTAVQRQALSHPDMAVRFLRDGEELLSAPGSGKLLDTIYCVYGRQFALELTPVESRWEQYSLSGYVTKPTATRGNRSWQQFFVNGRPVKSRLLSSALEEAYRNQIMTGRFPGCVLHLSLPANAVDVNVHPAKTEVKFLSERGAFDAVHYGVLAALNRTPARPEMTLGGRPAAEPAPAAPAPARPSEPPLAPKPAARAKLPERREFYQTMDAETYRAFAAGLAEPAKAAPSPAVVKQVFGVADRIHLPASAPKEPPAPSPLPPAESAAVLPREAPAESPPEQAALPMPPSADYRVVGEVLDTYLIVEEGDRVLFLDKHAAHERILFEKLRADQEDIMAQVLMAPVAAALSRDEAAAVLENAETLRTFGFEVEEFGGGTVLIRQIPADLDEADAEAVLQELAARLLEGRGADPAAVRDSLLHTIACKAAIKAGWHTEPAERDDLVRQVMENPDIKYCPHGRPVCITLTKKQLEKQFKRS